eukprot:6177989-Pleurochrysis_carterae.AAC.6
MGGCAHNTDPMEFNTLSPNSMRRSHYIRFWHLPHKQVAVWGAMTTWFRIVFSRLWIECFLPDALEREPGPRYEVAPGVSAAALDNLSLRASRRPADGRFAGRADQYDELGLVDSTSVGSWRLAG